MFGWFKKGTELPMTYVCCDLKEPFRVCRKTGRYVEFGGTQYIEVMRYEGGYESTRWVEERYVKEIKGETE